MPVTKSVLEAVVRDLKQEEDFRFDAAAYNKPNTRLDVFPAVEDIATFDPEDAGTAPAYLAWSQAADASFIDGILQRPIVLHWAGDITILQTVFSQHGLWVRFVRDDPPRPGFGWSGRLGLAPTSSDRTCDILELCKAFHRLRKRGVVALENPGWTQSLGWDCVNEVSRRKDRTAVFWQSQGHERAFDDEGQLISPLHLYWDGELDLIASGLESGGFEVERPTSASNSIVLTKGSLASVEKNSTLEEVLAREPALAQRGAFYEAIPRKISASFVERCRLRLERKPVYRYDDGSIALLKFPEGAEFERTRIFLFGAVSAIAFEAGSDRLVVGSSKGEIVVLGA